MNDPGGFFVRTVLAFIALIVVVALVVALAGCGGNDAAVSNRDTGPAEKINFPDAFDTVATKCSHGNRIYVTQDSPGSSGVAVVPHDPSCPPR